MKVYRGIRNLELHTKKKRQRLQLLLNRMEDARLSKNYVESDRIRNMFIRRGYRLDKDLHGRTRISAYCIIYATSRYLPILVK